MGISANFPGINPYLRKIALRLKQQKVIEQQEDRYIIKTCSAFRNYAIAFRVGQEFQEFTEGLDNRHVKVTMEYRRMLGKPRGSPLYLGLLLPAAVTGEMARQENGV